MKQSSGEPANPHACVGKGTGEAGFHTHRQNDPGGPERLKPGQPLLVAGLVELPGGRRPLRPQSSRLGKIGGDSPVFKPIRDRASLRGRAKPLSIFSGAFNVIIIERKDRVAGCVVAYPEERFPPQIAWPSPRPFHMVGFRIGEPLSGKESA